MPGKRFIADISLGIGAVLGGNFFGWQSALEGGLGAAIIGLVPVAIMYAHI